MGNSLIIGAQTPNNKPLIFEVNEYDKYVFPYEEEVPEGTYYAQIKKVEPSENKYHDECFDVYLKLLPPNQAEALQGGWISTLTYYYIRQRYRSNSGPAQNFKASMVALGLPSKFSADDLEGTTATIQLEYSNNCGLGKVKAWEYLEIAADWFTADEDDDEYQEDTV